MCNNVHADLTHNIPKAGNSSGIHQQENRLKKINCGIFLHLTLPPYSFLLLLLRRFSHVQLYATP